jgi:hypothetical protein
MLTGRGGFHYYTAGKVCCILHGTGGKTMKINVSFFWGTKVVGGGRKGRFLGRKVAS